MSKKIADSRRKLLKSVAVGGGAVVAGKSLPKSWSKPVVNAVMLPAHAETTDDTGSGGPEVTTTAAPVCCDGYICGLRFVKKAPIKGSAELNNCTITFDGNSESGSWGGSGAISPNGSYSFDVVFQQPQNSTITETISGTVSADCLSISGSLTNWPDFTGDIVTSQDQCGG